jgi:uncharacterized phage-associated protein
MYSAKEVANYFIDRANREGIELTPLKLIKLVYFAHGWNLALAGDPLIEDPVEVWDYGPVIPSLYHSVKKYGDGHVSERIRPQAGVDGDEETRNVLDAVWDVYGDTDAIVLSDITHMPGTPWHDVYTEYDGNPPQGEDIDNSRIKAHFRDKLDPEDE